MGIRRFLKQEIPSKVPERAGWVLELKGEEVEHLLAFLLHFQVLNTLL